MAGSRGTGSGIGPRGTHWGFITMWVQSYRVLTLPTDPCRKQGPGKYYPARAGVLNDSAHKLGKAAGRLAVSSHGSLTPVLLLVMGAQVLLSFLFDLLVSACTLNLDRIPGSSTLTMEFWTQP